MQILSSILFVISANLDSFGIGINYGIRKIKINAFGNLIIAAISCLGTFLSMLAGEWISDCISPVQANRIGSWILILLGVYFIEESLRNRKKRREEQRCDSEENRDATAKELIILAAALTINNIGMGVGASIAGVSISIASLTTFAVSLLFISAGQKLGKRYFSKNTGSCTEILSGVILLILGGLELFH